MRVIGLDVHRSFAVAAAVEDTAVRQLGRVELTRERILVFARRELRPDDEVVLEATGNTLAVAKLLAPLVKRVVIANPLLVRAIAYAKVKTDKIDAAVLAKLHAAGFLPEVWQPDEATERLRRQVAQRAAIVQQMTRLKNRIHSTLHANLLPVREGKLFSARGRSWLAEQTLAPDERIGVDRALAELDRLAADLERIDALLAEAALPDPRVRRLMTVGGINLTIAVGLISAIGEVSRFSSPGKLVSYFGLNPRVRQSGDRPAYHGRIGEQERAQARALLVEAAWSAASSPGPLRAFFLRIKDRRGQQVAAVATARKIAVLVWHLLTKREDYAWARPALLAMKLRQAELKAGQASRRGGNKAGPARDYSIKALREQERAWVAQAEQAYARFVEAWSERPKPGGAQAPRSRRDAEGCAAGLSSSHPAPRRAVARAIEP
jgi:transposase